MHAEHSTIDIQDAVRDPYLAPVAPTSPEAARIAARDAWLEGSAFTRDGAPVLLFHGTDAEEPFNVFARTDEASIGFHFGTEEAANDRLAIMYRMGELIEGTVIPIICRATNPLRLRDQYTWDLDQIASELKALGLISEEEVEAICDSCQEEFVFAAIERAGFDCVIYRNESEHKGDAAHDSLMVWRAELLKSPFAATFDLDDPRLLPQNVTSADDLYRWRDKAETLDQAAAAFEPSAPAFG